MESAAKDRLLSAERLVAVMAMALSWVGIGGASLLARPLCGERLMLACLRGGEGGFCWNCCCWCCSWSLCCEMSDGWAAAFAPRLWADCNLLSVR